jgi:hypothetical protein
MRISKSTKTNVKASKRSIKADSLAGKPLSEEQVKKLWDKKALFIEWSDGSGDSMCQDNGYSLDEILKDMRKGGLVYVDEEAPVDACGDIKGSTETDKALKHIKAAIDILGKSGNKDAVTKDSIANLGVVMFDLKARE